MRLFLAGSTGVIGTRLVPLLIKAGYDVAAMTRSPQKLADIAAAGATPVLCDIFDKSALEAAVQDFNPEVLIHQVTDLPDDIKEIAAYFKANNRVRSEGTSNLLAAARLAGVSGFIAQSIAWPGGPIVDAHEASVLAAGGVVLKYGQFYGPSTYYESDPPADPKIHVDEAAKRTMQYILAPPGAYVIAETD